MARQLSYGKSFMAALWGQRGFSAAATGRAIMGEERAVLMKGMKEKGASASDASSAWVPDPVTGCYRPANRLREMDPVELRRMLLKSKA